jgi:hypothetical protein
VTVEPDTDVTNTEDRFPAADRRPLLDGIQLLPFQNKAICPPAAHPPTMNPADELNSSIGTDRGEPKFTEFRLQLVPEDWLVQEKPSQWKITPLLPTAQPSPWFIPPVPPFST